MVKKRLGRSSWKNKGHTKKLRFLGMPPNKSAQITVFIILGLLLLFIFMMTIKLATDAKLSGLEAEKEKVISKMNITDRSKLNYQMIVGRKDLRKFLVEIR